MAWYNTGYLYKKQITIDHTKVSGGSSLTNFPVLIAETVDDMLRTVPNGGKVVNASGYDIIFTDSTESTKLDHEIESYTALSGAIVMWVRIPTLSASANTTIFMYFGNSSISVSQENKTGVWDSNFKAVWHLKEATGSDVSDSTSNGASATQNNSPIQGAGKIDGSLAFNGSSQYLSVSSNAANASGDKTIETWINASSFANNGGTVQRAITNNIDGTSAYQIDLDLGGIFMWIVNDSLGQNIVSNSGSSTGIWYYLVGTYVASTHIVALYINGAVAADNGGEFGFGIGDLGMNLGRRTDGIGYFSGSLDEIRVSDVARSAGWIATEYNNQSSPSTFASFGATIVLSTLVITNAGHNMLRDGMSGAASTKITYVALGTSGAAPSVSDTRLGAETFRKLVSSYTNGTSPGEILVTMYLAPGDDLSDSIWEVGFFGGNATSAANSGVLLAHGLYNHSRPATATESIQFRLDLTI
jgi:hypothetical protein